MLKLESISVVAGIPAVLTIQEVAAARRSPAAGMPHSSRHSSAAARDGHILAQASQSDAEDQIVQREYVWARLHPGPLLIRAACVVHSSRRGRIELLRIWQLCSSCMQRGRRVSVSCRPDVQRYRCVSPTFPDNSAQASLVCLQSVMTPGSLQTKRYSSALDKKALSSGPQRWDVLPSSKEEFSYERLGADRCTMPLLLE